MSSMSTSPLFISVARAALSTLLQFLLTVLGGIEVVGCCLCGIAWSGVCVLVQQSRCVISNVGQLMQRLSRTLLEAGTLLSKCTDWYTFVKVYIITLEFMAFVLSPKKCTNWYTLTKVYRLVHFCKIWQF